MNLRLSSIVTVAFTSFLLVACGGSDDGSSGGAPVIDSLDVPAQTSTLTTQGQTGPGVVLTLTAHDDTSGLNALHVVFTELGREQVVNIPNAPTKLDSQKIELVFLGAPSGSHALGFYLSDAKNQHSATIDKTITVP